MRYAGHNRTNQFFLTDGMSNTLGLQEQSIQIAQEIHQYAKSNLLRGRLTVAPKVHSNGMTSHSGQYV